MAFVGYHNHNLPDDTDDHDWGFVFDPAREKWEVEIIVNGGTCATGMDVDELLEAMKGIPEAPPIPVEIAGE